MKILLIFPPMTIYGSDPTVPGVNPPLGLGYIGACLQKNGYGVRIIDALSQGVDNVIKQKEGTLIGLTDEEIQNYIAEYNPDVVGISAMFTAYARNAHGIAAIAKKNNPQTLVIFGGAHASINPETVLQDKNVDLVVIGEGELTFLEIIKNFELKKGFKDIDGLAFRDGENIVKNKFREFIKDLSRIPFPARDLLPMDIYIEKSKSPYVMRTPLAQMVTSRGCPQNCIFCSIHSVWRNKWRGREVEDIISEIELLINKYGIREISFLDDSMATSKQRMHKICDEIIKRKLDIKWTPPNGITHWTLDRELLDKMKKSGCYRVTFGIESGNTITRKFIRKPHSLEQATQMIKYANKIGMWTVCTFIIGFPYETKESIEQTIDYAIASDADYALFYLVLPFPGTELYEIYKKEGLLDLDDIFYSHNPGAEKLALLGESLAHGGCGTKYFTKEELQSLLSDAYKKFWSARFKSFLNPLRIVRKIKSLEDFYYVSKIAKIGLELKYTQLKSSKFKPQMVYKDYDKYQKQ